MKDMVETLEENTYCKWQDGPNDTALVVSAEFG